MMQTQLLAQGLALVMQLRMLMVWRRNLGLWVQRFGDEISGWQQLLLARRHTSIAGRPRVGTMRLQVAHISSRILHGVRHGSEHAWRGRLAWDRHM